MKTLILSIFILSASTIVLDAQTVVAANAIRARSIIMLEDLAVLEKSTVGGIVDPAEIIGQEAQVNLYAGRIIRASEVGPSAILERNQLVIMIYNIGSLLITAEGRVLDRAGVGELVRVMNLDSRLTVTGRVLFDGKVEVRS